MSTITTTRQDVEVTDVDNVIVTDIVVDEDTGHYVREIRIMRLIGTNEQQVFGLRITSSEHDKIAVTAPQQDF